MAVTIVGRPNAGKSSLVNRLLREERMIVSEIPGTTRDAVDTLMTWHRRKFRIVDTAGIRRPGRVARGGQVESVSVLLARRSIESADIVVLIVDATQGATDQDAAIAGEADKAGRGVIIVANKWDLVKGKGPEFVKGFDEELRRQLKFLDYAPILHISALTGERAPKLLETIDRVTESRQKRVKTPELNKFVAEVTAAHPPASPGRSHVRILYAAQTGVAPPTFVFFTNVATNFHFSYERFLVNQLRERFGFEGTPIRFHVRTREERRFERLKGSAGSKRSAVASSKLEGSEAVILGRVTPKVYKAGEVCELLQVQPYVLRSWEKEFPGIGVQEVAREPAAVPAERRRARSADQAARIRRRADRGRRAAEARGVGAGDSGRLDDRRPRKCSMRSARMCERASRTCATGFASSSRCCRVAPARQTVMRAGHDDETRRAKRSAAASRSKAGEARRRTKDSGTGTTRKKASPKRRRA